LSSRRLARIFFDIGIADEYRPPVSSSDPNMSALGATSKMIAHIPLDIGGKQSISGRQ
jgi:hypothetical protein